MYIKEVSILFIYLVSYLFCLVTLLLSNVARVYFVKCYTCYSKFMSKLSYIYIN